MLPMISIVMPVYNEEQFIRQTLEMLLVQDYPNNKFEILVVDGMSSDGTRGIVAEIVKEHANVQLLDNPKRKSSSGRNVGFKSASGEYCLVVDGHCYIPGDQLLASVSKAFLNTGVDCLGRPQPLDPPALTPFQKMVAAARASQIGHGSDSMIYSDYEGMCVPDSNGAAYSKNVFKRVGYVDESFDACEDVEFNYRVGQAGFKAFTSPSLMVKYYPRNTLEGLFKQMSRYGAGRYRLYKKHPVTLGILTLVPAFFVVNVIITILSFIMSLAGLVSTAVTSVFVGMLCVYLLLIGFSSLQIKKKLKGGSIFTLMAIYFIIHSGLGWGFISQFLQHTSSSIATEAVS